MARATRKLGGCLATFAAQIRTDPAAAFAPLRELLAPAGELYPRTKPPASHDEMRTRRMEVAILRGRLASAMTTDRSGLLTPEEALDAARAQIERLACNCGRAPTATECNRIRGERETRVAAASRPFDAAAAQRRVLDATEEDVAEWRGAVVVHARPGGRGGAQSALHHDARGAASPSRVRIRP